MNEETQKALEELANSWPHHRDQGWINQPIGSNIWLRLWDSGCDQCHKCELLALLRKLKNKA